MTRTAPISTRNEVSRAVRSALVSHGYADLTTAHIAEASSKSEASLFYYYETKNELLAVFVRRAIEWTDQHLADINTSNPDKKLRAICDYLLIPDEDKPLYGIQIALLELLSHAPHNLTLQKPLKEYQNHIRELLANEIRAAINDGIYRKNIDLHETTTFLLTILDGATISNLSFDKNIIKNEIVCQTNQYLDSLLI